MTTPATFAVCPHDTAKGFDKWAFFNTLVNKSIELKSRFCPCLNFAEFTKALEGEELLWAYFNPADYIKARSRFGYSAIARPVNRADIARIVGPVASPAQSIEGIAGTRLAAVNGYLFFVARKALIDRGIPFEHVPAKSYADVMGLLENGQADYGVTYNEHFDVLVPGTKSRFREIHSFEMGLSHVVAVHPSMPEEARRRLTELLRGPTDSPERRRILDTLGFEAFDEPPTAPFEALAAILAG